MKYIYTQENLLTRPHHYMYSEYGGEGFLTAYSDDRSKILQKLKTASMEERELLDKVEELIKSILEKKNTGSTSYVMADLINQQRSSPDSPKVATIDKFLKKFEVFKRLFTEYAPNLRKIGNNHRDISVYVLFSVNLALMFKKTHNLKYLNCLLKVNDTISTNVDLLTEELDIYAAVYSFECERSYFRDLLSNKGIVL